ncbi:MAG: CPXCG motif-containing cysteine-rich protein [Bdellovibrionales bacterium]
MLSEEETFTICPYCLESISFLLELFHGGQSYIEDCEVCCRPIQVTYKVEEDSIVDLQINSIEQ